MSPVNKTKYAVSVQFIKFYFTASFLQQAGREGSFFCSFLFGLYFEWGLSTKLINIIVQSHLFSRVNFLGKSKQVRKTQMDF